MDLIYSIIGTPLGWIMWLLYKIVSNYGIALFLFTLIMRLAMIPLTLRQQQMSAKMALVQPKLQEIQKKYANNQQKLSEEMNKLYTDAGYNPASGCLPMVIQLVVMFGLIDVIYRPLKHILRLPADVIDKVANFALELGAITTTKGLNTSQILAGQLITENTPLWVERIGQQSVDQILTLDLRFFGINLGMRPQFGMFKEIFSTGFNPLLLIPILAFLSAIAMSLVSIKTTMGSSDMGAAGASMKGMMLFMPLMSLYIAFQVPAGVGLYWFYSNIISLVQSLILHKYHNPKDLAEKARREQEERDERERQERIEAKKAARQKALEEGTPDDPELLEKALSQKEINRRKLAEARKRDAERYGETYVEVTDEDLV